MSKPDNPPAFPHGNPQQGGHPGMTIRDYFAGQALPTVVEKCEPIERQSGESTAQMFARRSYEIADAMLAERAKGGAE